MITFNRVFLQLPEGDRIMISQIHRWSKFLKKMKDNENSFIEYDPYSVLHTAATVSEIDEAICLAHGLKPGAPMMTIDHSKVPVQPDN
jgi:hypothetical protein